MSTATSNSGFWCTVRDGSMLLFARLAALSALLGLLDVARHGGPLSPWEGLQAAALWLLWGGAFSLAPSVGGAVLLALLRTRLHPMRGAAGLLCGRALDLNAATPESLEALPGIGPARARALAAARPFASVADVERVRGIGPALRRRLQPFVEVTP